MEVEDILHNVKNDILDFKTQNPDWIVMIRGSTATGKSKLSVLLADYFPVEIISADSRQIFRYMDIWTDKISKDITDRIIHHQINIVNPDENYTAWQWQKDSETLITQILERWRIPFVVWWTGLYIDTLYKNFSMPEVEPDYSYRDILYKMEEETPWILHKKLQEIDPEEAMKLHPNSTRHIARALEIYEKTWKTKTESCIEQPVKWPILMIWLRREKEMANMKINRRIKEMFKLWLVDEVKMLLNKWYNLEHQAMNWIWYKEIVWYINWEYDLEKAEELLKRNTHHYAKRQRTWFRRYILDSHEFPKKDVIYKLYNLD